MKYAELIEVILGYLIIAIIFMLAGAFLQWDKELFFEVTNG